MNGNVVLVVCCVVDGVIVVLGSALLVFVVGVVAVDVIDRVVDLMLVVGSEVVVESVLSVVGGVVDGQ